MAVIKHISVKGSNGGDALNYVLYKHNETTGELIVDSRGNPVMRDEYYLDGINCEPYSFAAECKEVNDLYGKNQLPGDIKAHHFIISYDPKDGIEHGLTGSKAQQLSMEWAKRCLPGFQILVCTHMDGSNESGNIHTHIMMNSVRKYDTQLDDFGERAIDHLAGYKLNLTKNHLQFMKQELMDLCGREGLYQIDLLSPAKDRITDKEYRAQKNGQDHLDKQHVKDNDKSERTVFQTQKQYLRDTILDAAERATSFDAFCEIMKQEYNITVKESRGRISYLHPNREKYITGRSLGSAYEKGAVLRKISMKNMSHTVHQKQFARELKIPQTPKTIEECHSAFVMRSNLQLVVRLQECAKAKENASYANKVQLSNVKTIAETILFVQQNGFNTEEELIDALTVATRKCNRIEQEILEKKAELNRVNEDIHFLGQYFANKIAFEKFIQSKNKTTYSIRYKKELEAYRGATSFLNQKYGKERYPKLKETQEKKHTIQKRLYDLRTQGKTAQEEKRALKIVALNVHTYLSPTQELSRDSSIKRYPIQDLQYKDRER